MRKRPTFLVLISGLVLVCSCGPRRPPMIPEISAENDTEEIIQGYIVISDGTFHDEQQGKEPKEFYVRGYRRGWRGFVPTSRILGSSPRPPHLSDMKPAWLELTTGAVFAVADGPKVPNPPYIKGYILTNGAFYPEPLEIIK